MDKKRKIIEFKWKYGDVSIDHKNNNITVDTGQEKSINAIKRNYSRHVLKHVAKKYGWLVKGRGQKQGTEQLKFVMQKK